MSDTFILYGVKFTQEEWVPLLGNLLVIIGVSLTLYIALFVGGDDAPEAPSKSSDTEKTTTPKKAVKGNINRYLCFRFNVLIFFTLNWFYSRKDHHHPHN